MSKVAIRELVITYRDTGDPVFGLETLTLRGSDVLRGASFTAEELASVFGNPDAPQGLTNRVYAFLRRTAESHVDKCGRAAVIGRAIIVRFSVSWV